MKHQHNLVKRLSLVGVFLFSFHGQAQQLSGGFRHGLFITDEHQLIGWGKSEFGELNKVVNDPIVPQLIDSSEWNLIKAGYDYSVGIKKDGSLWVGGYNRSGQLGLGNFEFDANEFSRVGDQSNWVDVSAGYSHVLAVKKDGTLWAWGNNQKFQLGTLTDEPFDLPVQVGTDQDWLFAEAGYDMSLALKKDGTLWSWGKNYFGQTGVGYKSDYVVVPTKVMSDLAWEKIAVGISATAGIKSDGSLWMWGRNYHGQLGNGSTDDQYSPVLVESSSPWKNVAVGKNHVLGIQDNGTLWAWGQQMSGELGIGGENGYSVYKERPLLVSSETSWTSISASEYYSLASKSDGSVWGWGSNKWGQLVGANAIEQLPKLIYKTSNLGIPSEVNKLNSYKVAPTIALDFIMIDGLPANSTQKVELINSFGQLVREARVSGKKINVSDLASGIYYLRFNRLDKENILRFIKK